MHIITYTLSTDEIPLNGRKALRGALKGHKPHISYDPITGTTVSVSISVLSPDILISIGEKIGRLRATLKI